MKRFNKTVIFIIFWLLITCVIFLIHIARNQSLEGKGNEINQKKEGDHAQKIMKSDFGHLDVSNEFNRLSVIIDDGKFHAFLIKNPPGITN